MFSVSDWLTDWLADISQLYYWERWRFCWVLPVRRNSHRSMEILARIISFSAASKAELFLLLLLRIQLRLPSTSSLMWREILWRSDECVDINKAIRGSYEVLSLSLPLPQTIRKPLAVRLRSSKSHSVAVITGHWSSRVATSRQQNSSPSFSSWISGQESSVPDLIPSGGG